MAMTTYDVHAAHCCPVHGCKYGVPSRCPVWVGKAQPRYPDNNGCEQCEAAVEVMAPAIAEIERWITELEPKIEAAAFSDDRQDGSYRTKMTLLRVIERLKNPPKPEPVAESVEDLKAELERKDAVIADLQAAVRKFSRG